MDAYNILDRKPNNSMQTLTLSVAISAGEDVLIAILMVYLLVRKRELGMFERYVYGALRVVGVVGQRVSFSPSFLVCKHNTFVTTPHCIRGQHGIVDSPVCTVDCHLCGYPLCLVRLVCSCS